LPVLRIEKGWIHVRRIDTGTGVGDRPVLVLAHALGMDLRMWEPLLGALDGRIPVVVWDTLGHGLSALPADGLTIDDQIDALAALLDGLGIARAVVGGISMGGMIALGSAARGDPRIAGVVGMATALRFGDAAMWAARIAAVESGGLAAITDQTMARWFARRTHESRRDEILAWRTLFARGYRPGYLANCRALAEADLTAEADRIRAPVLLLAGAEDPGPGPEPTAALADTLPHAQAVTITDAAHLLAIDQPQATADAVLDFVLRRVE